MNQTDEIAMRDFLDSITECCDDVFHSWSVNNLDISGLVEIKDKLNSFMIENKELILSFYDYAKAGGRYTTVKFQPLFQTICKYEEYHDDLMGFIKAILSEKKLINDPKGVTEKRVSDAALTDEKFRDGLFLKSETDVFPESISNLDSFMALYAFIDKAYDNFIYLSRKEDIKSPKVKVLIDLYATSVTSFLKDITTHLISYIMEMESVMSGSVKMNANSFDTSYKLI